LSCRFRDPALCELSWRARKFIRWEWTVFGVPPIRDIYDLAGYALVLPERFAGGGVFRSGQLTPQLSYRCVYEVDRRSGRVERRSDPCPGFGSDPVESVSVQSGVPNLHLRYRLAPPNSVEPYTSLKITLSNGRVGNIFHFKYLKDPKADTNRTQPLHFDLPRGHKGVDFLVELVPTQTSYLLKVEVDATMGYFSKLLRTAGFTTFLALGRAQTEGHLSRVAHALYRMSNLTLALFQNETDDLKRWLTDIDVRASLINHMLQWLGRLQ